MTVAPSSPERGPITTRIIAELESAGFPVGDNSAPTDAYGWSGEPNETSTTFTPWMSLSALTGVPQRTQAMGDTGREWIFTYNVFYAGVSRKQSEALADRMRAALTDIQREAIETKTGNWRILKVTCTGVGTNNRIGSAFPDYFTQADTFEVWITKER
jgi:hypothetical protein